MNSQINFSSAVVASTESLPFFVQKEGQYPNFTIKPYNKDNFTQISPPSNHNNNGLRRCLSQYHYDDAEDVSKENNIEGPYKIWAGSFNNRHINSKETYFSCRDEKGNKFESTEYDLIDSNYPADYDLDIGTCWARPSFFDYPTPPSTKIEEEKEIIVEEKMKEEIKEIKEIVEIDDEEDDDDNFSPYPFGVREEDTESAYFKFHGHHQYGIPRCIGEYHYDAGHNIAKENKIEGAYKIRVGSFNTHDNNTTEIYFAGRHENGKKFRSTEYELIDPNHPVGYDLNAGTCWARPSSIWGFTNNNNNNKDESQSINFTTKVEMTAVEKEKVEVHHVDIFKMTDEEYFVYINSESYNNKSQSIHFTTKAEMTAVEKVEVTDVDIFKMTDEEYFVYINSEIYNK